VITSKLVLVVLLAIGAAACEGRQSACPDPAASAKADASGAILYDLPRASADDFGEAVIVLSIEIGKDGAMMVDRRPVAGDAALLDAAKAAIAKNPAPRAIIKADVGTPWGRIIHVIDLVKQGGISRYAFAVEPVPR
jgi:biopolymer transport protein ExbD